jgi:hypothetical protein
VQEKSLAALFFILPVSDPADHLSLDLRNGTRVLIARSLKAESTGQVAPPTGHDLSVFPVGAETHHHQPMALVESNVATVRKTVKSPIRMPRVASAMPWPW